MEEDILRENNKLQNNKIISLLDYKIDKIIKCNHIFMISGSSSVCDGHRTDHIEFYKCIRCGLDSTFTLYTGDEPFLTPIQSRMGELYTHRKDRGILIDPKCNCSIELATEIYQKIIQLYPDMNRDEIIKSFHIELENYQKDKVHTKIRID